MIVSQLPAFNYSNTGKQAYAKPCTCNTLTVDNLLYGAPIWSTRLAFGKFLWLVNGATQRVSERCICPFDSFMSDQKLYGTIIDRQSCVSSRRCKNSIESRASRICRVDETIRANPITKLYEVQACLLPRRGHLGSTSRGLFDSSRTSVYAA